MLLFAFAVVLVGLWRRRFAFPVAVAGSALALAAAVACLLTALRDGPVSYMLGGWPRPLGIEYSIDVLAGLMATLVTASGLIVIVFGRQHVERAYHPVAGYLYSMILLVLAGLTGMVLTADVFNLFVFLEIASLSSYALIALGGKRGTVAAFRYLILGTVAGSLYLLGIGFLFFETGTLNMPQLAELLPSLYHERSVWVGAALIVTGLGIKAALYPLHLWLPDSYGYAPPTIAPLLASVGTKVGAYALLRLLFWVFGTEFVTEVSDITQWLLWLGMAGILIGSLQAVPQQDLRRLLAYSSVGQIGFIVLGVGLATPLGLVAALLHIINHAVMKACLFMAAGSLELQLGSQRLSDLAGAGSAMPWTSAAAAVAGLSLVGIPPTGGFFSKWYLIQAAVTEQAWLSLTVIIAGSLLTAVYVFRVLRQLYLAPPPDTCLPGTTREGGAAMVAPTVALAVGTVVLGLTNAYIVEQILRQALPAGF